MVWLCRWFDRVHDRSSKSSESNSTTWSCLQQIRLTDGKREIHRNVKLAAKLQDSSTNSHQILNSYIRSKLTYSCQNWNLKSKQCDLLDVSFAEWCGGFKRTDTNDENQFKTKTTNEKLHNICGTHNASDYISIRTSMERSTKQLLFNDYRYTKVGRTVPSLLEQVIQNINSTINKLCNGSMSEHGNWLQYVLALGICKNIYKLGSKSLTWIFGIFRMYALVIIKTQVRAKK